MKKMTSNAIANAASLFRRFRLERSLIAILAGLLLLTTTACNPGTPSVSDEGSYNETVGQETTELYQPIQPSESGSMNGYPDVDPRLDTSAADARAKEAIIRAEQNANKVQSPGDFVQSVKEGTPLGERVRNASENVGNAVQGVTEGITEGTQRGTRNLQTNIQQADQNAKQTVKEATQGAAQSVEQAGDRAVDTLRN